MKKQKAFTLIELLVVIAIIGLLASIVTVNLNSARDKAKTAKSVSFSQQIYRALGSDAVGAWDFNEASGATNFRDLSGNGNNGTCSNCPDVVSGLVFSGGGLGNALSFNGANDYVNCGNGASLNPTDGITIEAWIKPTVYPNTNYRAIIAMRTEEYGSGWYSDVWTLYLTSSGNLYNTLTLEDATHPWDTIQSIGVIPTNGWTHVVITWTKNSVTGHKLFINASLDKQEEAKNYPIITLTRKTQIGGCPSPGGGSAPYDISFSGLIDEVRIYNKALSQAQIQQHYVEGISQHQDLAVK